MQKSIITTLATLLTLVFMLAPQAMAKNIKIGIVDVEYCILKSKQGEKAKKKLKKIFEKKQKKLDKKQKKLTELKAKIENSGDMATAEKRKAMIGEYQNGVMKLQEEFVKHQQELAQKELELMKPILKDLEDVMRNIADKKQLDIIMNRSDKGVIYAKPEFDITEAVLKALDAQ